jgi:hypothetical protein
MERYDLARKSDRLALAGLIFTYPPMPHQRKHGPRGYTTYESYRDWLRDEFSYRCVFSLVRETWLGRLANFDIDHLEAKTSRPDLTCEYDNLLYLTHRLNLIRGKRRIPDPCRVALGQCLQVHTQGDRLGYIATLNEIGERIERIFRLNSEDAVAERVKWLRIMRAAAANDEALFRQLIGYPTDLPDLHGKRETENTRKAGLQESARFLLVSGKLPEWYY